MNCKSYFKVSVAIGLGIAGGIFAGCATISNQTSQKVALTTSNGQPVIAQVNGKKVNLPAKVSISRRSGANVIVSNEDNLCYETTQTVIAGKNKVSGWFWLNILWGGTTGSTTDAISGGMWAYANPNFVVPVQKKDKCDTRPSNQSTEPAQTKQPTQSKS